VGVNLLLVYKLLKVLSYDVYIFADLFDIEICSILLVSFWSIEFDETGVIEIADFLEAGLEYVPAHISVYLGKSLQLLNNLIANMLDVKLSESFCQKTSINCSKSRYKQFFHQRGLSVADLSINLFDEVLLDVL